MGIQLKPDVFRGKDRSDKDSTRFTLVWNVQKLPADIKACSLNLLIFKPDDPETPPKTNSLVGTRFTINLGKSGKDRNPVRAEFSVAAEEMKSAVLAFWQGTTEVGDMATLHFLALGDFVAGFQHADPFGEQTKPNHKDASEGG